MAHDLTVRRLRFTSEPPRLGADEVFGITGPDDDGLYQAYAAIKQGGVFHAVSCRGWPDGGHDGKTFEFAPRIDVEGIVYGPLHPSMDFESVEGATHAEDDGEYWHLSHGTPEEHHDFELLVSTACVGVFQPYMNRELVKALAETSGTPLYNDAIGKHASWHAFSNEVTIEARKAALAAPLGHFARNREHAHVRQIIAAAVLKVYRDWQTRRLTETALLVHWNRIHDGIQPIITSLRDKPKIKTLHESRLAAPKFASPKTGPAQSWTVGTEITPVQAPSPEGYPAVKFSSPFLPTGLSLDADTGEITGTPIGTGEGTITVKATNSEGTDNWSFTYTIVAA